MAEFIVAIELGSSKMTGIAGTKNFDGSIKVLAVVQEDSTNFIRKGVVYNLDKTVQALTTIVKRLETTLKCKIAQVYVGVGGQSVRGVINTQVKELDGEETVSQDMVDQLMDANRSLVYPEQEILDVVPQEYKVDLQEQVDPVGIPCKRLEGKYLNILCRKSFYRNFNKCFDNSGIRYADMCLSPLVLADSVLTDEEKRTGCALVDLGAETTTVSVYYKNILRHLSVIPLGSHNITKDLTSYPMEEADAERLKKEYGSAYTSEAEIDENKKYPYGNGYFIRQVELINIVQARLYEIIENVKTQIPGEYFEKLLGGIVLTGGGSNLKNIEAAFRDRLEIQKVRTAKFVSQTITASNPNLLKHDGTMNTVLAILAHGDLNCAGNPISDTLFGPSENGTSTTTGQGASAQSATGKPADAAATPADTSKAAAKGSAAASGPSKKEDAKTDEKAPKEAEEEEVPHHDSPFRKLGRAVGHFFKTIVSEEDEEK